MPPLRHFVLLGLLFATLAGCGTPPPPGVSATGAMRLAIQVPAAPSGDVTRVTVTVSGPDMAPLSIALQPTDGAWGGVLGDIPAGPHRTFLAQAFASSNTPRYEGRVEDVTVIAGATGLVSLTLQEVALPPPFTNEVPVIDSLVVNPTTVAPGGTVSLSASAHDPNAGDTVSYAWVAPSGSFAAPTQASTTWTAPSTQGPVTLSLSVSDSRGASISMSLTVTVSLGSGAEEVKVDFNSAPKVVSLTSSQSWLDVGQQTALSVSVTDADGDSLSYQWSATCAGGFTGAGAASATFTASALPLAPCNNCQLSVTVKDGRGGQNMGSVAICVAEVPWRAPPMVTRSYQSSPTARASQPLTFEVEARDPVGSALTFGWAATAGTPGMATTGATSSRITWTAPKCVSPGTTPSLTATITNALGLKATKSFSVTGPPACPPASWTPTGSMAEPRYSHTATLLANGKVLVAGGIGNGSTYSNKYLASAEVYDPATGTWSPTGSMSSTRYWHAATLLPSGKVLVSGGIKDANTYVATAEVYDPATGTWSPTGSMASFRNQHPSTLLSTGKVLVSGGYAPAELYDPATGTWSLTGAMAASLPIIPTATLLSDGKVLVAGGHSNGYKAQATAQVYDPVTNTWSLTGSLSIARYDHAATRLSDGRVLVSGGSNALADGNPATAEVYDPATGVWSPTGALEVSRHWHATTLLPTGKVLLSGGNDNQGILKTVDLYDPATGAWSHHLPMSAARDNHAATLLPSGKVLVSGGYGYTRALATAEVYDPGS